MREARPSRIKVAKGKLCFTELYFHYQQVVDLTRNLNPSSLSDLKITDINRLYLQQRKLDMEIMGRSSAWLDTGTLESLLTTSRFIIYLEKRQDLKVACPKEISYWQQWIDAVQLERTTLPPAKNGYGRYPLSVLKESVLR